MNQFPSVSYRSLSQWRRDDRWVERLCTGGLLLAALVLFVSNLGNLPLFPGEEATLAQIGKEMAKSLFSTLPLIKSWEWQTLGKQLVAMLDSFWWVQLVTKVEHFPQWLQEWQPPLQGHLLSQPPLVPWLMALSYGFGGVNPWTTRLPIALLTAISVPLLYRVAKELFRQRLTALYAGLIYLTSFGVVSWGRLGTSHGVILLATVLILGETLRVRRNLKAALGLGLSLTILGLTQPVLCLLLAGTAIAFLTWDTPRLMRSGLFWFGLSLGLTPCLAWYVWQGYSHHHHFWQSLGRIEAFERSLPWLQILGFYGSQLLQYGLPWVIFAVYGFKIAWQSLSWSWARFIVMFGTSYLFLILLLPNQWENALTPLYPLFALSGAIALTELRQINPEIPYPKIFYFCFLGLALIATTLTAAFYFKFPWVLLPEGKERYLLLIILVFISFTLGMTANLLAHRQKDFIPILFWGMFVTLTLVVHTPFWHLPPIFS